MMKITANPVTPGGDRLTRRDGFSSTGRSDARDARDGTGPEAGRVLRSLVSPRPNQPQPEEAERGQDGGEDVASRVPGARHDERGEKPEAEPPQEEQGQN